MNGSMNRGKTHNLYTRTDTTNTQTNWHKHTEVIMRNILLECMSFSSTDKNTLKLCWSQNAEVLL